MTGVCVHLGSLPSITMQIN